MSDDVFFGSLWSVGYMYYRHSHVAVAKSSAVECQVFTAVQHAVTSSNPSLCILVHALEPTNFCSSIKSPSKEKGWPINS